MRNPDSKNQSSKGNFIIPLLLIVISVAVVASTFYTEDAKEQTAQTDTLTEAELSTTANNNADVKVEEDTTTVADSN